MIGALALLAAHAAEPTQVWRWAGPEIEGVVGSSAFAWDRENNGITEISIRDGSVVATHPIEGLNINGAPRSWVGAPGGFLASWDDPLKVQDRDGTYAIEWWAPKERRWSTAGWVGDRLVGLIWERGAGVAGVDPAKGTVLWETPLEWEHNGLALATDGETAFVTWDRYTDVPKLHLVERDRVTAVDPETGKVRWEYDSELDGPMAFWGEHLVVGVGSDLVFVHGPSGREVARVDTEHPANIDPRYAVFDGLVYVGLRKGVTAYRMTTGERLWSTPMTLDGGPELARHGDAVYVTTDAGTVVQLDSATGTPRWEVSTGVKPSRLWVTDVGLVVYGSGIGARAAGFPLPARFEPETATIRGTLAIERCAPTHDYTVQVGDQRVEPGPDSAFQATVTMAGWVFVEVPMADLRSQRRSVQLSGKGTYDVGELAVGFCPRG